MAGLGHLSPGGEAGSPGLASDGPHPRGLEPSRQRAATAGSLRDARGGLGRSADPGTPTLLQSTQRASESLSRGLSSALALGLSGGSGGGSGLLSARAGEPTSAGAVVEASSPGAPLVAQRGGGEARRASGGLSRSRVAQLRDVSFEDDDAAKRFCFDGIPQSVGGESGGGGRAGGANGTSDRLPLGGPHRSEAPTWSKPLPEGVASSRRTRTLSSGSSEPNSGGLYGASLEVVGGGLLWGRGLTPPASPLPSMKTLLMGSASIENHRVPKKRLQLNGPVGTSI
jgi:hypothetical protein